MVKQQQDKANELTTPFEVAVGTLAQVVTLLTKTKRKTWMQMNPSVKREEKSIWVGKKDLL